MEKLIFNKNLKKVNLFIEKIKIMQYKQNKNWRINHFFLDELAENNRTRLQINQEFVSDFDWPKTDFT